MIYAVNTGLIDTNPASGACMVFKKPKQKNMSTLRPEELPKLIRALVDSRTFLLRVVLPAVADEFVQFTKYHIVKPKVNVWIKF